MTVAELLAHARAAHARSFAHRGRINAKGRLSDRPRPQQAGAEIQQALSARLDAHAQDPQHRDSAWLDDDAMNKGVSHDALVAFYGSFLSPPETPKAPPKFVTRNSRGAM